MLIDVCIVWSALSITPQEITCQTLLPSLNQLVVTCIMHHCTSLCSAAELCVLLTFGSVFWFDSLSTNLREGDTVCIRVETSAFAKENHHCLQSKC